MVATDTLGLAADEWFALLRIALGAWWFKSFWHKDKRAWLQRNAGIKWAGSVAEKHRWAFVGRSYDSLVAPRPRLFTYVVLGAELALGLGLLVGLLTPVALVASIVLNGIYLVLMINDFAEQGQNLMMIAAGIVAFGGESWHTWSLDAVLSLF
jgi:thiosulfate dehydrogenase [quinone] large subunit